MDTFFGLVVGFATLGPLLGICGGVVGLLFWVYTLIVVLNAEQGSDKTTWVLIILFTSVFGCVLYHLMNANKTGGAGPKIMLGLVGFVLVGGCLWCGAVMAATTGGPRPVGTPVYLVGTPLPNILTQQALLPTPTPTGISIDAILTSIAPTP